ncbi:MAG: tail fiber domain-containing protein [Bacteroidota bacterium]
MKKNLLLFLLIGMSCSLVSAQGVAIGGGAPAGSAMLHIKSLDKGLLIPTMSKQDRDLISGPANGLMIYQYDQGNGFYFYDQLLAQWTKVGADNLGNHTLSQNLITGPQYLSRTGSNTGLQLTDEYGSLRIRGYSADDGASKIAHDLFRFDNDGGFVSLTQGLGWGPIPATGSGLRMMWYPYKGAFRAMQATSTEMDDANCGFYSWAGGVDNIASGIYSFAIGSNNIAGSQGAMALGANNTVTGTAAFAAGLNDTATGTGGVALGHLCRAFAANAIAIGYRCVARGKGSVALGSRAGSSIYVGTMAMGDQSIEDSVLNTANNQFVARYAGGYRFYSNSTKTVGAFISAGSNSWASISDSTKKEKFQAADGEAFLAKLPQMKLGSWNYKSQPQSEYRHYGPIAQEIFAAYGKDSHGSIGNDTTLAAADMDGIMMVLLQALEKRSSDQVSTIKNMSEKLALLTDENKLLKDQLSKVALMQEQVLALQQAVKKDGTAVVNGE